MTWTARTRTSHNTLRLCLALTWVCSASTAQVQMILGQIVFYMSPMLTCSADIMAWVIQQLVEVRLMDYLIVYNGEPIGTMVSPGADASMGMVQGPFVPLPAYEKVRAVFRLFTEAAGMDNGTGYPDDPEKLRRFYAARGALDLQPIRKVPEYALRGCISLPDDFPDRL